MQISNSLWKQFQIKWHNGDYKGLRYGQAFYNHFDLHKSNDKSIERLYNANDLEAQKLIASMIDWDN